MNPETGDSTLSVGLLIADEQPAVKEEESSESSNEEFDDDIPF